MIIESYLEKIQRDITYEEYCEIVDVTSCENLNENIIDKIKDMKLSKELVNIFRQHLNNLKKIAIEFRFNFDKIIEAFKKREMYNILKSFSFNFNLMLRCLIEVTQLVKNGLFEIFKELHRTNTIQKIRRGFIKIDDLLNKYPLLKKIGGVAIAGLLLYLWLNMTFIGNLDYDFNFTDIFNALSGTFSLADLFTSPEGLMLLTLFGTGTLFGLSLPWLGKSLYNLSLAIFYTIYFKYKDTDLTFKEIAQKIKKKLKTQRI